MDLKNTNTPYQINSNEKTRGKTFLLFLILNFWAYSVLFFARLVSYLKIKKRATFINQ